MKKMVWCTKVQSRNFISDFGAYLKNIIGGNLKTYETMIDLAITQASNELYKKHPNVQDVKMQITEFSNSSISVTIYGVVDNA